MLTDNHRDCIVIQVQLKNGKVQTIVVPANFNALMMPQAKRSNKIISKQSPPLCGLFCCVAQVGFLLYT